MKKKLLVLALALLIAAPSLTSAKRKASPNTNNANNTTAFSVLRVSLDEVDNNIENTITITGTGFSASTTYKAKLGVWQDDSKDNTDDSVDLTDVIYGGETTLTAKIPLGAHAQNNQDITVYDSVLSTHYTLADAIDVHPSFTVNGTVEVFKSDSSSSKATFSLTVLGKSFKNKRWLKLKVGNKKAVITKVSRVGTTSVISAKYQYGKLAVGKYPIALTYKDRLKKGVVRKNKVTYKNVWENGTMTVNNAFGVNSQVHQSGSTCIKENSCKFRTVGSEFRCNADTTYNGENGSNWCGCTADCDVSISG